MSKAKIIGSCHRFRWLERTGEPSQGGTRPEGRGSGSGRGKTSAFSGLPAARVEGLNDLGRD